VHVAGAERIGHGVDIRHERNPIVVPREMARRDILVETPLVSNCQILEVCGREHPIRLYRRFGVPVALATDDEGVSRTGLPSSTSAPCACTASATERSHRSRTDSFRHAFLPRRTRLRLLRRQERDFRSFERGFQYRVDRIRGRSRNQRVVRTAIRDRALRGAAREHRSTWTQTNAAPTSNDASSPLSIATRWRPDVRRLPMRT
jgi:hypothetical protein